MATHSKRGRPDYVEGIAAREGEYEYPPPPVHNAGKLYKVWKPDSSVDLNKARIIPFNLKLSPGELLR
jgi:hypothetical protein